MKSLQDAGKIILFLSVLFIITWVFVPKLEADEIIYKGVSKCGGRQLEVSFVYDLSSSTIKDFKQIHSCVEEINNGEGTISEHTQTPIAVKDNKFSSSLVAEGFISPSGKASGKILGRMQYMQVQCSDKNFYHNCTDWVAEPQK